MYQSSKNGKQFVDLLKANGVFPGIKVDTGLQPLPGADPIETWCTGLDGLKERAAAYYKQGARFAKWRAVLQITADGCPTPLSIQENAWGLARYARAVQESGLVPIVLPAPVIATNFVRGDKTASTASTESSDVCVSNSAQRTVAPTASAAWIHGRIFES